MARIFENLQNVWKEAGATALKVLVPVVMVRLKQICDISKDDLEC